MDRLHHHKLSQLFVPSTLSSIPQAILRVLKSSERPMTVNHVTRQLFLNGLQIRERQVEKCLLQDLQSYVKKMDERWAARTNATETKKTLHPKAGAKIEGPSRKLRCIKEEDREPAGEPQARGELEHASGRQGEEAGEVHFGKTEVPREKRADEVRDASDVSSAEMEDYKAALAPSFVPDGRAGCITADLERAKQLALVLGVAARPLKAPELAEVVGRLGLVTPVEDVERLLASPLRSYVQREAEGWRLRSKMLPATTVSDVEKAADPGAKEAGAASSKEAPENPASAETHSLTARTRSDGVRHTFARADIDSPAFFEASMTGASTVHVRLNTQHPASGLLEAALEAGTQEMSKETLRRLLWKAQRAIQLLLVGWVRYEENLEEQRRRHAQKVRSDWGRSVRRALRRYEQHVTR